MKKALVTIFVFLSIICCLPQFSLAKSRVVTVVSDAEIVSNGLYFRVCEINRTKGKISLTVQAKNKSMLSQAVYIELKSNKNTYKPRKLSSIKLFNPLKFNKTITEKLVYEVDDSAQNYELVLYSKDIFKKNKKQVITKMNLNDIKKELDKKQTTTMF